MKKLYLGIDIGSISTKGVLIDKNNKVYARSYLWTEGNPIGATKRVIQELKDQIANIRNNIQIVAVGTTGSARELVGTILNAQIIKNEITAHALGTLTYHPNVRTIFEIGGQDSKIIILDEEVVVDYAMNTLCAAGTGAFLSSQARRLDVAVEEFGDYAKNQKIRLKLQAGVLSLQNRIWFIKCRWVTLRAILLPEFADQLSSIT